MIKRSRSKQKSRTSNKEVALIRENTATLYGLYFATSNTDFLLNEKKTRFSVRPDVVVKEDRQTAIFDYSSIKGSEQASIFDGFFRGLQEGTTCAAGVTGCSGATCCGSTLGLAGAVTTTCNFINDVTGIPKTDFADTYTLSKVDVTSKTIVAIKETPITTTTAVQFNGDYFIDLPQWTKTQENEISTPVKKIVNLLSSQSLGHLGIRRGSVLEFKKTKNNNKRFTVIDLYVENGLEVIEVDEEIVQEDATDIQVIVAIYVPEDTQEQRRSSDPPLLPAPIEQGNPIKINSCCPLACMDCIFDAIRQKESGGSPNSGCDALNPDDGPGGAGSVDCAGARGPNPTPADKALCWACGPYQIKKGFFEDAKRYGGSQEPACEALGNLNWETELCLPCTGTPAQKTACCERKHRLSRLVMMCWWRRYTRNGKCQSGNGPCQTINTSPGKKCFTCEDLVRQHNRGTCAHRPTQQPQYDQSTPRWEGIKDLLCNRPECRGCCDANYNCDDYNPNSNPFPSEPKPGSCGCGVDPNEGPLKPANDPPELTPGRRR